jgi:hypothetical protein
MLISKAAYSNPLISYMEGEVVGSSPTPSAFGRVAQLAEH